MFLTESDSSAYNDALMLYATGDAGSTSTYTPPIMLPTEPGDSTPPIFSCDDSPLCRNFTATATTTPLETVDNFGPEVQRSNEIPSGTAVTTTPPASAGTSTRAGTGSKLWLWLLLGGAAAVAWASSAEPEKKKGLGNAPQPLGKPAKRHKTNPERRHVASLTI
jgi:hypothetical protein